MMTQPSTEFSLLIGASAAELLGTALNAVADRVAVVDTQGAIVMVNAAWWRFAQDHSPQPGQIPSHSDLGSNYLAVVASAAQAPNAQASAEQAAVGIKAVLSGQIDYFALQYPCHSPQQQYWFNMTVKPIAWAAWRGAVIAHADVTPQELVRQALAEGELRFSTLFDNLTSVALQGYALDGTTRYWNPASERLYGYTRAEALGKNLLDLIIPAPIQAEVKAAIAHMAQTGQPIPTGELSLQHKDGSRVQVLSSHTLIHSPGQPTEFFCADIDLSARYQLEDALRESEQRFRSIANATPVMIWLAGTDTLCYWFNAGWLAFTSRTLEQEAGNGWVEGVHPDDLERCVAFYLRHFEQRLPFQMEYRLRHHSGQYRWIHDSGVPRFDAQGVFVGYIGSCVDSHEVRTIKDQLAAMADAVPGVVYQFITHPDGRWQFSYLSQGIEALYGVSAEAGLRDHNALTLRIPEEDRAAHRASVERASQSLTPWQYEYRITTPDGTPKWVRGQATPQLQSDGSMVWSGILTDISAQKVQEAQLRLGASVFANVQESIVITDTQRNIVDINAAFTRTTGYSRDEVLGGNPRLLKSGLQDSAFYQAMWRQINQQGFWIGEVSNRHKDGTVRPVLLNINAVTDAQGRVSQYVGVATDINELKIRQDLLEHVAHYDALTNLPNRVLLADRLHQSIVQAHRNQTQLAVCYLDLDGFKRVNDTLGHAAGDLVLQTVAQRMGTVLRASDTAARLGGDEFVVLLSDLESPDALDALLQRMLQAVAQPIAIGDQQVSVGASMGVSVYPVNATEPDTLLRQADIAMFAAKAGGKNRYQLCGVGTG